MKDMFRHILRGSTYLFDLSGEKSRRLRRGLMGRYFSRGVHTDGELLSRDAGRVSEYMQIALSDLKKRYE